MSGAPTVTAFHSSPMQSGLMRDGLLHWMQGDWRCEEEPDLFSPGVYVYN